MKRIRKPFPDTHPTGVMKVEQEPTQCNNPDHNYLPHKCQSKQVINTEGLQELADEVSKILIKEGKTEGRECGHGFDNCDICKGGQHNKWCRHKPLKETLCEQPAIEKICQCRGNLNANNPELPCSSCGGKNPLSIGVSSNQASESNQHDTMSPKQDT